MKKLFLVLAFVVLLLAGNVLAQRAPGPKIVIEHITKDVRLMGSESKDPDVKLVNTQRNPVIEDVIDAMKDKKQVTLGILMSNGTDKWAHAVRIRGINLTSYNGTNSNNETTVFHDVMVYDPTTNQTYNTTLSYIYNYRNDIVYLYWYGWAEVRDVITLHKTKYSNPRPSIIRGIKKLIYLPLINVEKSFLVYRRL